MVAGAGCYVFFILQGLVCFLVLAGSLLFAAMQARQRYEGTSITLRRLRRIQFFRPGMLRLRRRVHGRGLLPPPQALVCPVHLGLCQLRQYLPQQLGGGAADRRPAGDVHHPPHRPRTAQRRAREPSITKSKRICRRDRLGQMVKHIMNKIVYTITALLSLTSCAGTYDIQGSSNVSDLDGRSSI